MSRKLGFFTEEFELTKTEKIKLTFNGMTLAAQILLEEEDGRGEYLLKGLLALLTPESKRLLYETEFTDFNLETGEMEVVRLSPAEKLMGLVGGIWPCLELMFYLRFGDKAKAKRMADEIKAFDPDMEPLKKKEMTGQTPTPTP